MLHRVSEYVNSEILSLINNLPKVNLNFVDNPLDVGNTLEDAIVLAQKIFVDSDEPNIRDEIIYKTWEAIVGSSPTTTTSRPRKKQDVLQWMVVPTVYLM